MIRFILLSEDPLSPDQSIDCLVQVFHAVASVLGVGADADVDGDAGDAFEDDLVAAVAVGVSYAPAQAQDRDASKKVSCLLHHHYLLVLPLILEEVHVPLVGYWGMGYGHMVAGTSTVLSAPAASASASASAKAEEVGVVDTAEEGCRKVQKWMGDLTPCPFGLRIRHVSHCQYHRFLLCFFLRPVFVVVVVGG